MRPLIAAASKLRPKLAFRIYAPEPCARFRVGARWSSWATFDGSARRGARSIKHTCSTAAESPWLEVSTVGLSCRLLIAGTMQQMALIAIPTSPSPRLVFPLGLPSSLSLPLSPCLPLFRTLHGDLLFLPPLMPFFSHPSSRVSSPLIRSDVTRLHMFDFISQTNVPLKNVGILFRSLF